MRRGLRFLVAGLGVALAPPAAEQGPDLEFTDAASCRVNEIPLGQPARIEARRAGARLEVRVAVNFGCATQAGRARVEEEGGEIRLHAETLLPGVPTPACKCTRHLEYRFTPKEASRRLVFYKDGRVEGEGEVGP